MKHTSKGFTLIEMLVVIAIIAILASIVITSVSSFQKSARDTRRIADLRNMQSYLELYFTKCGHYPGVSDSVAACSAVISGGGAQTWGHLTDAMKTVTENDIPQDPIKNGTYYYQYFTDADGLRYLLTAKLEKDNSILQKNASAADFTGANCSAAEFFYCPQH